MGRLRVAFGAKRSWESPAPFSHFAFINFTYVHILFTRYDLCAVKSYLPPSLLPLRTSAAKFGCLEVGVSLSIHSRSPTATRLQTVTVRTLIVWAFLEGTWGEQGSS